MLSQTSTDFCAGAPLPPTASSARLAFSGRQHLLPAPRSCATYLGRDRAMWQPRRYDSAMDSPLSIARPWTPPDMDPESSPHSDYFSDPFRPPSHYSTHVEKRWPLSPETPAHMVKQTRPKVVERLTEPAPYTPTKNLTYGHANADGALRYPYTPDSSRILRRNTEVPSSPLPWDDYSDHSSSPVQDALSSCIAHFENLIHSQQPDEDQMEFIVRQFEAMTSYLSAPDSQTRKTDDHLFSEADLSSSTGGMRTPNPGSEAYIAHVNAYIASVQKHIEDLKLRLDEVKTLNSIQLDVIADLRRQMQSVQRDMRKSLDVPAKNREFGLDSWMTLVDDGEAPTTTAAEEKSQKDEEKPRYRRITIVRKPERRSFWASFGQALDKFGELWIEE
jgi:hypothetical protein